jgi:hypothetical protein
LGGLRRVRFSRRKLRRLGYTQHGSDGRDGVDGLGVDAYGWTRETG